MFSYLSVCLSATLMHFLIVLTLTFCVFWFPEELGYSKVLPMFRTLPSNDMKYGMEHKEKS